MDESQQPKSPDIWHREIPGTGWMRKLGPILLRFVLALTYAYGLSFVVAGIWFGWYLQAAQQLGKGPTLAWLLILLSLLAIASGLIAGYLWHFRKVRLAGLPLCMALMPLGRFVGPSEGQIVSGEVSTYWIGFWFAVLLEMILVADVAILCRDTMRQYRPSEPGSAIPPTLP